MSFLLNLLPQLLRNNYRRLTPLLVFALLALFSLLYYFRVMRPKKGTVEWISRFDAPSMRMPRAFPLRWSDAALSLITVFAAVVLRLIYTFFYMGWHHFPNPLRILLAAARMLAFDALCAALLAVAALLLLKTLFGKQSIALLGAVIAALTVSRTLLPAAAMLLISLLFLFLWMTADHDATVFACELFLTISALAYMMAFLLLRITLVFAPFYVAAYIAVLRSRWKYGDERMRRANLTRSLLLTLLIGGAAAALFFVLYRLFYGMPSWDKVLSALHNGAFLRRLRRSLQVRDFFVFAMGAAAILPLLHGLYKRRDVRCLLILLLAIPFAAMWLVSGVYMMPLVFVLAMCYVWRSYIARRKGAAAMWMAAFTVVFYFADLAVWLII
ncbi:MAG: hypothetical protein LBM28_03975 [Oscillospiraceae bacterium]|jgi:hypothetical protein|nr:hypothetical protein [Oscillospiraceae bacterium]